MSIFKKIKKAAKGIGSLFSWIFEDTKKDLENRK